MKNTSKLTSSLLFIATCVPTMAFADGIPGDPAPCSKPDMTAAVSCKTSDGEALRFEYVYGCGLDRTNGKIRFKGNTYNNLYTSFPSSHPVNNIGSISASGSGLYLRVITADRLAVSIGANPNAFAGRGVATLTFTNGPVVPLFDCTNQ